MAHFFPVGCLYLKPCLYGKIKTCVQNTLGANCSLVENLAI